MALLTFLSLSEIDECSSNPCLHGGTCTVSDISNARDRVSSGYPKTEKGVESTTYMKHYLEYLFFSIETESKQ